MEHPATKAVFQRDGFNPHDRAFALKPVLDEIGDRADFESMLTGESDQIVEMGDLALAVEYLDDDAGGLETGKLGQINARLGVAGTDEHAAGLAFERADVTGAAKVGGLGVGVETAANRPTAIRGADAAGHAQLGPRVDRDREGGAVCRGVLAHLRIKMEPLARFGRQTQAELARRLTDHEVDHFRRDKFSRADEIALVLAVLIIDQDDEPTRFELFKGLGNRTERAFGDTHR